MATAKLILFVCVKNVTRSQMAEGFFNSLNRNPDYIAGGADGLVNVMTVETTTLSLIMSST
ncbi:MAG: hypothetical protein ACFE7E_06230 [Candidatus Hodarchaeota archaeon]